MPFTPSNTLDPNPSVKIIFTGLLILRPGPTDTCQVFIHNSCNEHSFLVETRRKRPNKPDVVMMRIPGPVPFTAADPTRTHGLLIRTAGLPANVKGVKAYNGNVSSTEGTKLADSFDLARILDVSPGNVDGVGGLPSIFIDHGILYTAETVAMNATLKKIDGSKIITLATVPTIIAANIYLNPADPAQKVNLTWRQNGQDVSLDLKGSANHTYEIYINNEPLFEDDSASAPVHDEFQEYFKILPEVRREEQFNLIFPPGPIPDRGSSRTPCMSVVLGG